MGYVKKTMRRLRKYSESLGDDYSWDVVSSCEQNSMQAIATNDDILIYDPENGLYCRHSDVVRNSDLEAGIFDMLSDPSLKRQVMCPAKGDDFNKFAAEWNALQKEDRPDILKTKKTTTFAFNTNEGRKPSKDFMDDKVEKFRKRWRKLGAGAGVNGIEAQVSESRDFDEELLKPCPKCGGEAKFETVDDFPWVGGQIECADCGHHVYEVLSGPDETRSREEMMDILIDMWNNGEDLYDEETDDDVNDWSASNEEEFTVRWLIDDEELGIEVDDEETVVVDLDYVDSFEELVRQAAMELKHNHDGMRFDYDVDWVFPNEDELLKRFGYSMDE